VIAAPRFGFVVMRESSAARAAHREQARSYILLQRTYV